MRSIVLASVICLPLTLVAVLESVMCGQLSAAEFSQTAGAVEAVSGAEWSTAPGPSENPQCSDRRFRALQHRLERYNLQPSGRCPVNDLCRNQGNIVKARAEVAVAQQNVERMELLLQDQLADVFRDYEVSREQVEQYRNLILPDAGQSLELTRLGYQQGEIGYLELLTAQQTYSRTHVAHVDQLRTLWLAAVKIDGLLLTGGLDLPEQSTCGSPVAAEHQPDL